MPQPIGTSKVLAIKAQGAQGTLATSSGGSLLARRPSSALSLKKAKYTSNAIRASMQRAMGAHGMRSVEGNMSFDLVPGDPGTLAIIEATLRRDLAAVTALTGLSITVAAGAGGTYTLTRAAGDYTASGVRRGHVVRLTAGSFTAATLNANLLVVNVTTAVLTVFPVNGVALTAEGPITSATLTVPGKATYVPATGHTNRYFSIEEWYPEITASHRHLDCKFGMLDFDLPGSGIAGLSTSVMGRDRSTASAQYFTSPTAAATTAQDVSVNGVLIINGTKYVTVTDMKVSVNAGLSLGKETVGSNLYPDVFSGQIGVDGSFGSYFSDGTLRDLFENATEIDLACVVANGTAKNADCNSLYIPRLLIDTDDYADDTGPVYKTHSFSAGENTSTTGGKEATSFQYHDTAAP